MAQYKTHTRFNLLLALPLIVFVLYKCHLKFEEMLTFSICFSYSTLFLNPDMDISYKFKLFSLKGFLTFPFRIYSAIFTHRGISHNLFLGSITRILFLALFIATILFFMNLSLPQDFLLRFWNNYKHLFLFGFLGIFLADLCHLLLDMKK